MINYPNKKKVFHKRTTHSNRGMSLEKMINESNQYYLDNNIAIIHKKPIPIQIVKVDYESRQTAVIKEAYYKIPSTTDYNGIYKGKYIDFEAKETKSKTSFPLANIHSHQVDHLIKVQSHGGVSFIVVYFSLLDELYIMSSNVLEKFIIRAKNGRKSISIDEFRSEGVRIKEGYAPRIDYLSYID